MKKLLSAVLVLLALGVAAFFFVKLRRFLPERARAAELAPADTILFVQVPSLRETAFRVPGLDLYAIWMEPDVQAFLEKPRRKAPWMQVWQERYEEIVRVAPGEMFIAFTALGAQPDFVGGFSFAGNRSSAEELLERSRNLLPGNLVMKPHAHWMFFARTPAALDAAIERYEGKSNGPVIGGDPAFQQAMKALGVPQDFIMYGRADAVPGLANATGKTSPAALATKIEKGKLHDTVYLPTPPATSGQMTQQTLALTSPQTLFYYAGELATLPGEAPLGMLRSLVPQIGTTEKALAAKGLSWSDLPSALGPEMGAIIEWPEDAALPVTVVASQVRDATKAQLFIDGITTPPNADAAWAKQEVAGVATYNAPPGSLPFLRPALALTDRFALAALSPEALATALNGLKNPAPTLATSAAFQDATRFISSTPDSMAYLDFPRLFERVYRMARPFITLSLAFSADAGTQFDAGKLPPAETITKHLSPLVVIQTRRDSGLLIESTGSLTFPEMLVGLGLGATTSGLPSVAGQLRGLLPGNGLPPAPTAAPSPSPGAPPAPLPLPH